MAADACRIAAIDQGSSGTKGALFDRQGHRLSTASAPVERSVVGLRVEQDPNALLASVEEVLDQLLASSRPAVLGLTCQRSTCLVWEEPSGLPLTPAVSWQDRRATAEVEALAAHGPAIAERTGLRLSPHYAAPKLGLLLRELGASRARADLRAGTLDAFLVRHLTGHASTEPGHAGRTLLYNLRTGTWDPHLCSLFRVPVERLPPLMPSAGRRGTVRGVPLTAVVGDQQAALLGQGGWSAPVTIAHFGTGCFVLAATGEAPRRHPGLLTAVLAATADEQRFQLEGSINSAGSAADWVAALTGSRLEDWTDRRLDPAALPLVLPAFAGLGAPWWQPRAQASISGLDLATGPDALLGGVLAGVALRTVDCLAAFREAGLAVDALRASGRLTRLSGLTQLLADAGQLQVEVSSEEETGLLGVARLAALDLGEARLDGAPPAARVHRPEWTPDRAGKLVGRWRRFVAGALRAQGLRPTGP